MNPVRFSAHEILDMAIRIEENGEKFYRAAAEAASDESLKRLFDFLANEEVNHTAFFTQLKKSASDDSSPPPFDPYVEETSLYIKALSDAKVFSGVIKGRDLGEAAKDTDLALDCAIEMEKDSLLFYYELERMVRERDKKTLEKIITEEKEHLIKLLEVKEDLASSK
ncbi:MAG: ferritin family protein [Deltaproteobacteria bacterium]|nr:ferritin family protein [Deltaproteobacteria bacterium]